MYFYIYIYTLYSNYRLSNIRRRIDQKEEARLKDNKSRRQYYNFGHTFTWIIIIILRTTTGRRVLLLKRVEITCATVVQ